jgi:quinol monooxygenase YgiN
MVIQCVQFTFSPEDADRAAGILKELRDLSREELGVVNFTVARSKERPTMFALWEQYCDEAALKSHIETEHFRRLVLDGIRRLAKERLGEIVYPLE